MYIENFYFIKLFRPHKDFDLIDEGIYHEITCEWVYNEEVAALTYVKTIPISTGHSIFGTTVYVNKKYCTAFWVSEHRESFSWFILDLMFSIMHEIVHILFPQFRNNEEKIDAIAVQWLNSYEWSKRQACILGNND